MKQNIHERLKAFYILLRSVIASQHFSLVDAQILVASFEELKDNLSIVECTVDRLRGWHKEYNDEDSDYQTQEAISEMAFQDLASGLRDPEVQMLLETYSNMAGTCSNSDVYVQIRNIRIMSETGHAVVTLVTDSVECLIDILKKPQRTHVERSHFSIDGRIENNVEQLT